MRKDGRIVILTGAGISKESGLDTFRDEDGLWAKVDLEEVATYDAYRRDPVKVLQFYNDRRRGMLGQNIRANAAHEALARLQRDWPDDVLIVTQNIDDLHEQGGSEHLIHMHGEMNKARCDHCSHVSVWADADDLTVELSCGTCGKEGGMRPHVVWFGEMPLDMDRIYAALRDVQPVRFDRHVGQRLPGGRFRTGSPLDGRRAHRRAQPRTVGGRHDVRRGPLWAGDRGRAGLCRRDPELRLANRAERLMIRLR